MTRFIVHIGPHKTGTTYIQETLAALQGTLLGRGIFVPSIWNAAPGLPSHMRLVWALRSGDLIAIQDQIHEILAHRYQYVVISCEALSRLDHGQIARLRQLLGSASAEVVYYVRRWPERLPSLWQETVKFGSKITFPEFLAQQLVDNAVSELRDTVMIDRFAAVFGTSQIRVVAYSHLIDQNLDIAGHFLASFLGLSDIELPIAGRPNQSLPVLDTELIRALNAIHVRNGGEESPALRNWFLAQKEALVPETLRDSMRGDPGILRLDEAGEPLVAVQRNLVNRYAQSIVPPHHPDGLHALQAVDVPFVRQDYLLDPSMKEILNYIYGVYRRTNPPS